MLYILFIGRYNNIVNMFDIIIIHSLSCPKFHQKQGLK